MALHINDLQEKKYRILSHLLFWIIYISFYLVQSSIYITSIDFIPSSLSIITTGLLDIFATYFTVYFLLPRFLLKQKYLQLFVFFFLSAGVFIITQRALSFYIRYPLFYPHLMDEMGSFWRINPFYSLINIYSIVGLFTAIKMIKYWFLNQQMKIELENKNKSSELALLRSQLNPHFLFNTLNNIDSLIMSNQQKASDAIIKLSDILRSVIYESEEIVPIYKEIDYLNNYIDLQNLRLKDPRFISFQVNNLCAGQQIAPMLFIPFVENAFKHGLKNVPSPGISIHLTCQKKSIIFEVSNQYNDEIRMNKDEGQGIGLSNTKRRLELLYPNNHQLFIQKENNWFKIKLVLTISEHEN